MWSRFCMVSRRDVFDIFIRLLGVTKMFLQFDEEPEVGSASQNNCDPNAIESFTIPILFNSFFLITCRHNFQSIRFLFKLESLFVVNMLCYGYAK